jgi:hypothetical protein
MSFKVIDNHMVVGIDDRAKVVEITSGELYNSLKHNYDTLAEQEALFAATTYKSQRAAEYPPISDYLDGVVKGDQEQIAKYIADCLAVKAKYPKP